MVFGPKVKGSRDLSHICDYTRAEQEPYKETMGTRRIGLVIKERKEARQIAFCIRGGRPMIYSLREK